MKTATTDARGYIGKLANSDYTIEDIVKSGAQSKLVHEVHNELRSGQQQWHADLTDQERKRLRKQLVRAASCLHQLIEWMEDNPWYSRKHLADNHALFAQLAALLEMDLQQLQQEVAN